MNFKITVVVLYIHSFSKVGMKMMMMVVVGKQTKKGKIVILLLLSFCCYAVLFAVPMNEWSWPTTTTMVKTTSLP